MLQCGEKVLLSFSFKKEILNPMLQFVREKVLMGPHRHRLVPVASGRTTDTESLFWAQTQPTLHSPIHEP